MKKYFQSNNNNEAWVKARQCQCKQFSIMFGKISKEEIQPQYLNQTLPTYFDYDCFPSISPDQIVWIDETHIQKEGGRVLQTGILIWFPQDTNDLLPPIKCEPKPFV